MTDRFPQYVGISIAGHLIVVLMIFFKTVLSPDQPIDVRHAIRVDIVGLPQKMQTLPEKSADKPKPAPAPAPVKEAAKPKAPTVPTVDKKKVAAAEKNALRKLQEMEALSKLKEHDNGKSKTPKAAQVAGNQISAGNSLTGLSKIEYDEYLDQLENKVHNAWNIPQWLAEGNYKAQVQVLIDDRGYVIKKVMKKSSGNDIFDSKVMEAIDASAPLPAPPARLRGLLSTSGIIFNFPE